MSLTLRLIHLLLGLPKSLFARPLLTSKFPLNIIGRTVDGTSRDSVYGRPDTLGSRNLASFHRSHNVMFARHFFTGEIASAHPDGTASKVHFT
jgi:hypothetical protein